MTNSFRTTARISPDRFFIGAGAITLVSIIMLASYVFSYTALRAAAVWSGVPEWATYLAPVFLDGALLTYSVSRAVFKWRGEHRDAHRTLWFLLFFTGISVAINAAHAASEWGWNFTAYETWFGVLIGVSAPIAALISAEEVVRLSFSNQPATTTVDEPVTEPQHEPVDEYLHDIEAQPTLFTEPQQIPEFNLIFEGVHKP